MTKAKLIGTLLLLYLPVLLLAQTTIKLETSRKVVDENSLVSLSLRNLIFNGLINEIDLGLQYDPEVISFNNYVITSIDKEEDFEINVDESLGLIHVKYKRDSFAIYQDILDFRFDVIGEDAECSNFSIVPFDENTPIKVNLNGIDYYEEQLILIQGGVCIKNEVDDPVRQTKIDPIHERPLNLRLNKRKSVCLRSNGAVGKDYFMQYAGGRVIRRIDKIGKTLRGINLNVLSPISFDDTEEYSNIIYDHKNESWIISELFGDDYLSFTVLSDDLDPRVLNQYGFQLEASVLEPSFVLWGESLVISTRTSLEENYLFYFINVQDLMSGIDLPRTKSLLLPIAEPITEAHILSAASANNKNFNPASSPIVLSVIDDDYYAYQNDLVELMEFEINWDDENDPSIEKLQIPMSLFNTRTSWSSFGDDLFYKPSLRKPLILNTPHYYRYEDHEALVFALTVNVEVGISSLGVRWAELRKENGGTWYVYQEGTFAPEDDKQRVFGSAAIDQNENILLTYLLTDEDNIFSLIANGRKKEDPLGKLSYEELVLDVGFNSYPNSMLHNVNTNQMVLDADDRCWVTSNSGGGSQIVAIDFDRDEVDLNLVRFDSLHTLNVFGENETISLGIKNEGLLEVEAFKIELFLNGEKILEEDRFDLVLPGQEISIDLEEQFVIPQKGKYTLEAVLSLEGEAYVNNNKIEAIISRVPDADALIEMIQTDDYCDENISNKTKFRFTNIGYKNFSKATVLFLVNGLTLQEYFWSGNLSHGNSYDFELDAEYNLPEESEITIELRNVTIADSGTVVDLNKISTYPYFKTEERFKTLEVLLKLDDNPEEVYWTISTLGTRELVAEGGPYFNDYSEQVHSLCLSPYECYLFSIHDLGGDGLQNETGEYVHFGYSINTDFGFELIKGDGSFGSNKTHGFCIDGPLCQIKPEIIITPASNNEAKDGKIEIILENRIEAFQYRIEEIGAFQESPIFENLKSGSYQVEVITADEECEYSEEVYLDFLDVSSVKENRARLLQLSPNPTTGFVSLLKLKDLANLEVVNLAGQRMQIKPVNNLTGADPTLDLNHLPKGLYIVKCNVNDQKYVGKLILQ